MGAEKTDRQSGRKPFGKAPQTLSTVGRELAGRGQRVRWNAQRQCAEIVNRRVSTHPTANQRNRGNSHERDDATD